MLEKDSITLFHIIVTLFSGYSKLYLIGVSLSLFPFIWTSSGESVKVK